MRVNSLERFVGCRFNRLTVEAIERRKFATGTVAYADCLCDCGTRKAIALQSLKTGSTKSCGCLERARVEAARLSPKPRQKTSKRYPWVWTEEKAEARRKWRAANKERIRVRRRRTSTDPVKLRARKTLQYAVSAGKVERLPCEGCGNPDSQGHHDDYSKPLEVRWLCARCHAEHHRKEAVGATSAA